MTSGPGFWPSSGVGRLRHTARVARRVERPEVPATHLASLRAILSRLPQCLEESAWTGVRWRIGQATVAHVFGGEDQLIRVTFRAEPDEVIAFQHLGGPYFRAGWGGNVVGLILGDDTDWVEVRELLTDSYCLQAPSRLADAVDRPGPRGPG